MKIIVTFLSILFSFSVFAETIECRLVGGIPSTFMVTSFIMTKNNDGNTADFHMKSTKGAVAFSQVACKDENVPDAVYSCEHDDFIMILATDEKPLKAVINPILNSGKEHGPFFYLCK